MSKHIVMCDDDLPILRAAEIKLSKAGYRVTCCNDGQEAFEAVERERPDLLLTDCQMPRMGGIELIQKLRERDETRDLPILMLTGKGFELPIEELREKWGVAAVIPKPFSPKEVLKFIDGVLTAGAAV